MAQVNLKLGDEHVLSIFHEEVKKAVSEVFSLMDTNIRDIFREEIQLALTDVLNKNHLPTILTRSEAMEVLRCGATTMSELMRRPDFPVIREFGVRIPTHLLMKWIEENTQWIAQNTKYFKKEAM